MGNTKVIAVANQKGGVGKTTTTATVAAILKQQGYRVLVVDLDPQGNLSDSVGADSYTRPTMYEVMKREISAKDTIQKMASFDVLPANIMLAGLEQELYSIGKEHRLKENLDPVKSEYDFIFIDTPPSLGVLTANAFTAADEIIIPTTAAQFAAKGIRQMYDTIRNIQRYSNPNVVCAGILLTKYDPRSINNRDMKDLTEQVAGYMNSKVYKTYIRSTVAVEEAQARATDLVAYKNTSTAAQDYQAFVKEYLEKEEK